MLKTHHSRDLRSAIHGVDSFLLAEPVRRNQFLTTCDRLLSSPGSPEARCWWVTEGGAVTGFALQAATGSRALLTAATSRAVESLAEIVHATTPDLSAVGGEAWAAAIFAGAWTDLSDGAAEPVEGERLYELRQLTTPQGIPGSGRQATAGDVPRLADWHVGFCSEVGVEPWPNRHETMASRVAEREVWVWEHEKPVAMASATRPIAGASRIAHVYTPPRQRGMGYGAAATAAATSDRLAEGAERCLLFTQLANGTSNGIYRRLGYRAIEERLVYRLSTPR